MLLKALSVLDLMPKQNDLDLLNINGNSIFRQMPPLTFL